MRVTHTIDLAGALDFIRLTADIAAVHLRLGSATVGRRVGDLAHGAADSRIVALHRGNQVLINPAPDTIVEAGDSALIVGPEARFRAHPVIERMFYHPPRQSGWSSQVRSQAVPTVGTVTERDAARRRSDADSGQPLGAERSSAGRTCACGEVYLWERPW
jgi:hypothetical protein